MKNFLRCSFIFIICFFISTPVFCAEDIKISMDPINKSMFPGISFSASITYKGEPLTKLTRKDFQLHEDKTHIKDFHITIRRDPVNFALILDSSASIKKFVNNIKEGAEIFVDEMQDRDEALIVKFSNQVSLVQKRTSDKDSLKNGISSLYPVGGTKLYDGLYKAVSELDGKIRCAVLFTDGRDEKSPGDSVQYSQHKIKDVIKLARKKNITIYTIGVGQDVDKKLLGGIAKHTKGKFFYSADPSKIAEIYKKLSVYLNYKYKFTYKTENLKRDNEWRNVIITQVKSSNSAKRRYRVNKKDKIHDLKKNTGNNKLSQDGSNDSQYDVNGKLRFKHDKLGKNKLNPPKMDDPEKLKGPHINKWDNLNAPQVMPDAESQKELDDTFNSINENEHKFRKEHNEYVDNTMDEVNKTNQNSTDDFNDSMENNYDDINETTGNSVDDYNDSMEDYTEDLNMNFGDF